MGFRSPASDPDVIPLCHSDSMIYFIVLFWLKKFLIRHSGFCANTQRDVKQVGNGHSFIHDIWFSLAGKLLTKKLNSISLLNKDNYL